LNIRSSFTPTVHDAIGQHGNWTMMQKRMAIYALCLTIDICAVIAGFVLASQVRSTQWLSITSVPLVFAAVPLYVFFAFLQEAYSVKCLDSLSEAARRVLAALGAAAITLLAFAFFAQIGAALSRIAFAYAILSGGIFLVIGRMLASMIVRWWMNGATVKKLLIVDGTNHAPQPGTDLLKAEEFQLAPNLSDPSHIDLISKIVAPYDKVFLSCTDDKRDQWIVALKATGVTTELLVASHSIYNAVAIERYGKFDTLVLSRGPLSLSSKLKKRIFDLALAIPILILIAPLLIVVAVAICLESKGPALFTQNRIGRSNQTFRIYKFRSMGTDKSDENGTISTQRDDNRITRVGRFIRATSIDELPQLFNVVLGNMSLVGPRPHAFASTAGEQLFWEVSEHYWMRHALKPGITGLAQVRGFRGSTEKAQDLQSRLRCDLEYLENWSLWQDITILFATIRVIVHDNAF
jgi:polysaccharide biosynthesis protein PslA